MRSSLGSRQWAPGAAIEQSTITFDVLRHRQRRGTQQAKPLSSPWFQQKSLKTGFLPLAGTPPMAAVAEIPQLEAIEIAPVLMLPSSFSATIDTAQISENNQVAPELRNRPRVAGTARQDTQ